MGDGAERRRTRDPFLRASQRARRAGLVLRHGRRCRHRHCARRRGGSDLPRDVAADRMPALVGTGAACDRSALARQRRGNAHPGRARIDLDVHARRQRSGACRPEPEPGDRRGARRRAEPAPAARPHAYLPRADGTVRRRARLCAAEPHGRRDARRCRLHRPRPFAAGCLLASGRRASRRPEHAGGRLARAGHGADQHGPWLRSPQPGRHLARARALVAGPAGGMRGNWRGRRSPRPRRWTIRSRSASR